LVEKLEKNEHRRSETIWEATHYPKGGGLRRASLEKSDDGHYFLRIGFYNKEKNISETQTISLDKSELAIFTLNLLREMIR
jgi:hypothetical protein